MSNSRWNRLSISQPFGELDDGGYLDRQRCGKILEIHVVSDTEVVEVQIGQRHYTGHVQ